MYMAKKLRMLLILFCLFDYFLVLPTYTQPQDGPARKTNGLSSSDGEGGGGNTQIWG